MVRFFAFLALSLCVLFACDQDPVPKATDSAAGGHASPDVQVPGFALEEAPQVMEGWDVFVNRFVNEHLAAHPAWAVAQGRHEFDGLLPDWSENGILSEIRRLHAARAQAFAYPDVQLSDEEAFQRDYLVARIDHDLFWLEKAGWPFRNPRYYLGWMSDSLDPAPYLTLDYAPLEERMAAFTRYLVNLPQAAEQIRDNLHLPMPATWLELGVRAFSGYASYFRDEVPALFATVRDASLQARFEAANAGAVEAMQGLADWLSSNRESATELFALGPALFEQMLWDTERVDISLDELEAIGKADMQRNLAALELACLQFAPGESLADCMARMSQRKPQTGPVAAARAQLAETRRFLESEGLVSIPGDEVALVAEAPPYMRSNAAYINIPGPWESNQPSLYYISPPDPGWPQAVQAAYIPGESDLLFTSVHEVWPGHFLNFLHAKRSDWPFGRAFVGYAFAEGWAHYTEEMMVEAGLRGADPETRIGQLSNALLRNARFLAAIGLHARGWSVERARRFFIEEAFQSEGTALQQADRGTYDPAYLNYTMGKLLIRRLREDWTADRNGRAAWRAFHDRFLSFGGPPVPLVRQRMMNERSTQAVFPSSAERPEPAIDTEEQLVFAWRCEDDRRLVTSQAGETLWLFKAEETLRMIRNPSASGVHYLSGRQHFHSKGDESILEEEGTRTRCRIDYAATPWEAAKLHGADFRAVGNEPGWLLEIFSGRPTVLETHYGEYRYEFMTTKPRKFVVGAPAGNGGSGLGLVLGAGSGAEQRVIGSRYTSTLDGVVIEIELLPGPCMDTMADIEYETRVTVRVGPETYQGCGRALH